MKSLGGFSVVLRYNAAEFFPMANSPFGLRIELNMQNGVVNASSLVRAVMMVVVEPGSIDVVQLVSTDTNEMVQAGLLECANE